jgi:exodeoxyribonuclease V alpha subunit
VLVTANDYAVRLFNGDIGIVLPAGKEIRGEEGMRAYFQAESMGTRAVPPQRIPRHLPAYAMTVHRSQGSEYDRVLLILPDRPSAVVTRELLYTAITRARVGVEIWGHPELFQKAIETRIERSTGLRSQLHPAPGAEVKFSG